MNKKTQDAIPAFLSLLRVGLWEDVVTVNGYGLKVKD